MTIMYQGGPPRRAGGEETEAIMKSEGQLAPLYSSYNYRR